jgi:ABC-type nitrate/sulfonate/bicarbonate transport system substrate-binding protein
MHTYIRVAAFVAAMTTLAGPGLADTLRVGKPTPTAYSFALLEVGIQKGIFKKHGLDIETVTLAGGAKVHQAMIAGSIDVGLGSGPDWGFIAKGAPEKGVGQMAGPLLNIAISVRADGSVKSPADLKGRSIGVTTSGSLTDWCAQEFSRRQGWGSEGLKIVSLGSPQGMIAALTAKNVDAVSISVETSLVLESKGEGKLLVNFGDTIKNFVTHVIFATNTVMEKRPDDLRGFLKGWYETIAYTRANRDETIRITREITKLPQPIAERVYDIQTPMFPVDGHFDREAVKVVKQSLVDMGQVTAPPADEVLFTEKFLP